MVQESGGNPSAKSSDDITMGEEPDQDEGEILSDEEEAEKVGGADDVSGSGKSGKRYNVHRSSVYQELFVAINVFSSIT